MANLSDVIRVEKSAEHVYRWNVPDSWQQGRGAFGGIVFGAMASAMRQSETDGARLLRSLTVEIPAPVMAEEARVEVTPLRIGNAMSTWNALLRQGDTVAARASAVFGSTRVSDRDLRPPPPESAAQWKDGLELAVEPPMGPVFGQHFDYRNRGPLPFGEGPEARAEGWIRPKEAPSVFGPEELVTCIDAWWPTLYAMEAGPRPMATVSSTIQLFAQSVPNRDEPLYYRAVADSAQDGFILELRELWTLSGQLLVKNQQTFVVIK